METLMSDKFQHFVHYSDCDSTDITEVSEDVINIHNNTVLPSITTSINQ